MLKVHVHFALIRPYRGRYRRPWRPRTRTEVVRRAEKGGHTDVEADDNKTSNTTDTISASGPGPWITLQLLVQISCIILPLGYGGIETESRLLGRSMSTLSTFEKAALADANEIMQLVLLLLLLRSSAEGTRLLYKVNSSSAAPPLRQLTIGICGGPLCLLAVECVTKIMPSPYHVDEELEGILSSSDFRTAFAFGLASFVLAPALEETVYRGVLLQSLTSFMPRAQAVAASAVAFAAGHFSISNLLPLTVLGFFLGGIYVATDSSLTATVIAHGIYNLTVYFLASGQHTP